MGSIFLSITSGGVNVASIASRRDAPVAMITTFAILIFYFNGFIKVFLGMIINERTKQKFKY